MRSGTAIEACAVPVAVRARAAHVSVVAALVFGCGAVGAEDHEADGKYAEARAAFAEGRYRAAADLAESAGTAAGFALAAESLAIEGHYFAADEDRRSLLERAIDLGERAVRLDPAEPEAHFQLAHAVGRYAQSINPMKALREGFVGRSRASIEAALELDPDMASARLSLGSWNADVVAHAGRLVARIAYGATVKAALDDYDRALELAPGEKVVYAEVARGLLALDRRKHRVRARELLGRATSMPSRDAFDEIIQAQAQLAAMEEE